MGSPTELELRYDPMSRDELIAECERLRDRQWRPIETEPDGRERVLLWFEELGYPVVGFQEAYGYKSGGWKATHWAPLPPPPTRPAPRQTRYCDYDLCEATFDPAHSNNDH